MARLLASNQATGVRIPDPAFAISKASIAERPGTGFPVREAGSTLAGALNSGIG